MVAYGKRRSPGLLRRARPQISVSVAMCTLNFGEFPAFAPVKLLWRLHRDAVMKITLGDARALRAVVVCCGFAFSFFDFSHFLIFRDFRVFPCFAYGL